MTWQGRQLARASKDGKSLKFTYDSEGIRTSKTVDDIKTEYFLNGTQILAEKTGNEKLFFFYDQQGNRVAMADGNNHFYYYIYNVQGDVIALADGQTGKLAATYTYDAWGKCTVTNASGYTIGTQNPFRYRGYYYDTETGLYYLNSRYYDPEVGRFINADATEILEENQDHVLQHNLFAYCLNNPVNMSDQNGDIAANIVGAIAGGLTGAALGYYLAKKLGLTGWKRAALIAAAIAGGAALGAFLGPYIAKLAKSMGSAVKSTIKTVVKKTPKSLCFVAGTLVDTQVGHIPIEEIKVGDYVYAEDPVTGEKELKQVVKTFINQTNELICIQVDSQTILTTPNHPFFSSEIGWIEAQNLRTGDNLLLRSGEILVVEDVQYIILEAPVNVYNFEVEDFHTYYVTSLSILVHNSCQQTVKEFLSSQKNARQVLSFLKDRGFKVVSQNGSHIKLVKGGKSIIVPNHGGKDIAIGTLRSILKQAGLL